MVLSGTFIPSPFQPIQSCENTKSHTLFAPRQMKMFRRYLHSFGKTWRQVFSSGTKVWRPSPRSQEVLDWSSTTKRVIPMKSETSRSTGSHLIKNILPIIKFCVRIFRPMKFKYLFHYKFIYDATFIFSSKPDAGARSQVPGKITGNISNGHFSTFSQIGQLLVIFLFRLIFIFSHANPRTIV